MAYALIANGHGGDYVGEIIIEDGEVDGVTWVENENEADTYETENDALEVAEILENAGYGEIIVTAI